MRFALVVLVACSNTPRERTPIMPPADARIAVSSDAGMVDAAFAGEPDRDEPPRPTPISCRSINGPNERFKKCIENGKIVELARPITLPIQSRAAQGTASSTIIVGGGAAVGITSSWAATLLDARDREIVEASVAKLDYDRIELHAPISIERADNFARTVRFTPPVNSRLVIPAAPLKPLVFRVIARQVVGTRTQIIVAAGFDQGIQETWRAEVIDRGGRSLATATIGQVRKREVVLFVQLAPDAIDDAAARVRFTPP